MYTVLLTQIYFFSLFCDATIYVIQYKCILNSHVKKDFCGCLKIYYNFSQTSDFISVFIIFLMNSDFSELYILYRNKLFFNFDICVCIFVLYDLKYYRTIYWTVTVKRYYTN